MASAIHTQRLKSVVLLILYLVVSRLVFDLHTVCVCVCAESGSDSEEGSSKESDKSSSDSGKSSSASEKSSSGSESDQKKKKKTKRAAQKKTTQPPAADRYTDTACLRRSESIIFLPCEFPVSRCYLLLSPPPFLPQLIKQVRVSVANNKCDQCFTASISLKSNLLTTPAIYSFRLTSRLLARYFHQVQFDLESQTLVIRKNKDETHPRNKNGYQSLSEK